MQGPALSQRNPKPPAAGHSAALPTTSAITTMNTLHIRSIAALCLATGLALAGPVAAQGGTGPGPKAAMPCANAPASAPCTGAGAGMGMGMGMGQGKGHGGMAGADYTHGWSMMTPQERSEHQAHMQGMKSTDECRAYRDQHHQQMAERTKAQGGKPLPKPRHDACAGMKP
jgi:hypothetical protein